MLSLIALLWCFRLPQQPFIPPPAPDFADEPAFCGLLISALSNPIQACLDFLGEDTVDPYYQGCVVDVSVVVERAARAACDILNILVESCQKAGIAVDKTWRTIANCSKYNSQYFNVNDPMHDQKNIHISC